MHLSYDYIDQTSEVTICKRDFINLANFSYLQFPSDAYVVESERENENNVYFGAYSITEPYPTEEIKKNTIERWIKTTDTPGWRRAWGIFDSDRIIGSADIAGGDLPTSLHRVDFGIGIMKEYRNLGLGSKLINTIIDWCKEQPSISWIDLGVFSGNDVAKIVFKKNGFKEIGYKKDAWLVDGNSIGETVMTIPVNI